MCRRTAAELGSQHLPNFLSPQYSGDIPAAQNHGSLLFKTLSADPESNEDIARVNRDVFSSVMQRSAHAEHTHKPNLGLQPCSSQNWVYLRSPLVYGFSYQKTTPKIPHRSYKDDTKGRGCSVHQNTLLLYLGGCKPWP